MSRWPFIVFLSLIGGAGVIRSHPLPSFQFDRQAVVTIRESTVEIRYHLELSLFAMAIDARGLLTPQDEQAIGGRQKEFAAVYARKKAPLIADALLATIDDTPLSFQSTVVSVGFEETHAKFEFRFTATRPAGDTFHSEDHSFEDKPGQIEWRIEPTDAIASIFQAEELRGIPAINLTTEQAKRRRFLTAKLAVPSANKPIQSGEIDITNPNVTHDEPLISALRSRGLIVLFDSHYGLGILMLAALLFGAAHAVTPGHGKTLVAAYLVGERGTITHAVLLGLSTTISHTGSVITVAIGLRWAYRDGVPETVQGILQLIGGLLILGIGGWLLMQRARNRADHVHWNLKRGDKPSWFRVVLLGLAGGIVPCWDAVMLLLVAISAGKLAFALPLLVAFSIGLAAVLVMLGIAVVWAANAGGNRFGDAKWFRMLPVLSAILLVGLGLWFCRDGWQSLSRSDARHADR